VWAHNLLGRLVIARVASELRGNPDQLSCKIAILQPHTVYPYINQDQQFFVITLLYHTLINLYKKHLTNIKENTF